MDLKGDTTLHDSYGFTRVHEVFAESPRVGQSQMRVCDGIDATRGWHGSPMTAWIGGYRGSSIIRMKNDSEVST